MKRPSSNLAGHRLSVWHENRGTWVSVYHADDAGIDSSDGGKWAVVCELHSTILQVDTLAQAKADAKLDPDGFCEECRGTLLDTDAATCFNPVSSNQQPTGGPMESNTSTTRITKLSALQVAALRETHRDQVASGTLVLTATTAEWAVPATRALALLEAVMSILPTKGHPRASLHAVVRKLEKEATAQRQAQYTTDPVNDDTEEEPKTEYLPVTTPEVEEVEVGPLDPAADFLLDLHFPNLFESTINTNTYRCKGCEMLVNGNQRKAHHNTHLKNRSVTKMSSTENKPAKPAKVVAKDLGVPAVYLGPTGTFKPGADAALKSDLILAILEQPARKNAPHSFTKDAATKLFAKFPQWNGFLDRKREIVAAKAAAAAKKAEEKAARTKAAADAKVAKAQGKDTAPAGGLEAQVAAEQAEHDAKNAPNGGDDVKPDPKPASSKRSRSRK